MTAILETMEPLELLRLHTAVIEELKRRDIVRTNNSPVGDYTEWLVAKLMKLNLAPNSASGYDATSEAGVRFQIKGRRPTASNKSRMLSAIRNYEKEEFDYLIAVIFNEDFSINEAYLVPQAVVGKSTQFIASIRTHIYWSWLVPSPATLQ